MLAINSHRNLGMTGNAQSRSSARLSSGFRINNAADDAAGLAISEKMRGQIRGLDQASRNGQDGISLIQTAEGAMSTINDMVIRIRELVVQAANDTNAHAAGGENMAQSDRLQIQREINALMEEIDTTAARTQFNTRQLIDGSLESGTPTRAAQQMQGNAITTQFWGATNSGAGAISNDATAVTLEHRAGEMNRVTSGDAIWFQVGANMGQGVFLSIESVNVAALASIVDEDNGHVLGIDISDRTHLGDGFTFDMLRNLNLVAADATGHDTPNDFAGDQTLHTSFGVLHHDGEVINRYLHSIDLALAHVAGQRANLGAMQNRLEFTIENLDVASENLSAANSRIRDADMAAEMMRFTQSNVLQQAAISMLAQANQAPQNILSLLR